VDPEKCEAVLEYGILTVTFPIVEIIDKFTGKVEKNISYQQEKKRKREEEDVHSSENSDSSLQQQPQQSQPPTKKLKTTQPNQSVTISPKKQTQNKSNDMNKQNDTKRSSRQSENQPRKSKPTTITDDLMVQRMKRLFTHFLSLSL
jgi:hypothetical protein